MNIKANIQLITSHLSQTIVQINSVFNAKNLTSRIQQRISMVNNIICEMNQNISKQQSKIKNAADRFLLNNNQDNDDYTFDSTHYQTPTKSASTQSCQNPQPSNDLTQFSNKNDKLFKQYEQLLQTYNRQRNTLHDENEIVLNRWLNSDENMDDHTIRKNDKRHSILGLVQTLLFSLSKHESINDYICEIEEIENQRIIAQLKNRKSTQGENDKKWFDTTNLYIMEMARILKGNEQMDEME